MLRTWAFILMLWTSAGLLPGQTAPLRTPEKVMAKAGQSQPGSSKVQAKDIQPQAATLFPSPQSNSTECDEVCQQGRQNLAIQAKLEIFTGALVLVGFLQVASMTWQGFLLRSTLKQISRQADLSTVQANFQATAMKQWLDVRVTRVEDPKRLRSPTHPYEVKIGNIIEMRLEAVNRTSYPLTFQKAKVMVTEIGSEEESLFACSKDTRLVPGSGKGSSVGFLIIVKLRNASMKQYHEKGLLMFSVVGDILFTPALGPPEVQEFGFLAQPASGDKAELPMTIEMTQESEGLKSN